MWYVLGIIELLLAFRFLLKLLGANAGAGFTSFIYGITHIFVAPFQAVFRTSQAEGSIVEWSTLLAMFVYWVIAISITKLLFMGKSVTTPEASRKLDEHEGL